MIYICNINDVNPEDYDEVWIIMRSQDQVEPCVKYHPKTKWVPVLSPSVELFHWYRQKKKELKWTDEVFQKEYVPAFLKEIHSIPAYLSMKDLFDRQKNKKIAIGCTCPLESRCHRSIIGGILKKAGAEVYSDNGTSCDKYISYGDAYFTKSHK